MKQAFLDKFGTVGAVVAAAACPICFPKIANARSALECAKVIVTIACAGFAGSAAAELVEVKLARGTIVEKRLTVASGKFAELCSALHRGQAVSWQFHSETATDFNIHYHVGKRVEYPEQRENVKDANGRLVIEIDQDYCWMWTNRSAAPIVVDVTLKETGR